MFKLEKVSYYEQAIELFTLYLKMGVNFNYAKLGDGELYCINGTQGINCDHHPYTTELADKLVWFIKSISKYSNFFVAKWIEETCSSYRDELFEMYNVTTTLIEYNSILPRHYNLENNKLLDFYTAIKQSKKRKIYVGPDRLRKVTDLLDVDIFIEIPLVDAFGEYEATKSRICDLVKTDDILMYSCSMMAKPLICEILECNPNITNIDIGSGIDSIILPFKTRLDQPDKEEIEKYFNSLYKPKVYLLSECFVSDSEERNKEINECSRLNKANPLIDVCIYLNNRPSFSKISKLASIRDYDINIIANADIYFDEENIQKIVDHLKHDECFALSRWDVINDTATLLNRADSQDVWVFKGPPKLEDVTFTPGIPGCDNKLAYILSQRYKLKNPSKTIQCFHLHNSNYRTYSQTDKVEPPYLLVPPEYLN